MIINQLRKKLRNKKNSGSKNGSEVKPIKIRTTSKAVIELLSSYKVGENNTFGSIEPKKEADIYNRFLSFIRKNKRGNKLPRAAEIELYLNIGSKERKALSKKAFECGILIKPSKNSYEFADEAII